MGVRAAPRAEVLIVTYGCSIVAGELRPSDEHSEVRFHDRDELDQLRLPSDYRRDVDPWVLSR